MQKALKAARSLHDTVAIVTGASSGIGAATAWELARQGATVILTARRTDMLATQRDLMLSAGYHAAICPTDVRDPTQVAHLVASTIEQFGRVDVLVNCAGIGWLKPLVASSPADINQVIATNMLGTILPTHAVLPTMLAQRHGAIIAVASVSAHIAVDPLYSATKFGVRGFMLGLRRDLLGSSVSVSLISPGFIRTAMRQQMRFPVPRPELAARAIAHLIRHPKHEIIVPAFYHIFLFLDFFFPWLVDFAISRGRVSLINS